MPMNMMYIVGWKDRKKKGGLRLLKVKKNLDSVRDSGRGNKIEYRK